MPIDPADRNPHAHEPPRPPPAIAPWWRGERSFTCVREITTTGGARSPLLARTIGTVPGRARTAIVTTLLALCVIVGAYPATYVQARSSHRLVRYFNMGGPMGLGPPYSIQQAGLHHHPPAACWEEKVYFPLIVAEEIFWWVRG